MAVLLPCFVGCSPAVPDLYPFSVATARLSAATAEVYDAAQASVNNRLMIAEKLREHDPNLAAELKVQADLLDKSVQVRKKVLAAFVVYTERLAAIAESAGSEQQKVDDAVKAVLSLSDSVATLASLPGSVPSAGMAKEIAVVKGDVTNAIDQMRASKTLADATSKAAVAVTRFTEAVSLDLTCLEGVFRLEPVEVAGMMQQIYMDQLGLVPKKIHKQREQAVKALNDAAVIDAKAIDAVYEQDLLATRARDLMGGTAIDAASNRAEAAIASIDAVRIALREWADAHEQVALAIRKGWQPNLGALADAVAELTKRVADLRKDEETIRKVRAEQRYP
jgi:hypothetical protein